MADIPEPSTVIEPVSLNPDSDLSNGRAEIDTSAPFESVREAATRFGGFGFWKPSHNKLPEASQEKVEETDIIELKAQASELQRELIVKERETLEVLKELEATKATVLKLQQRNEVYEEETLREEVDSHIKPAGVVLKDLNQAKMNLCKIASIRESVEQLKKKLNEERAALEKTRERLMEKSLKVISLEEEEVRVRFAKEGETDEKDLENNALGMLNEVQRLSREAQEVKITGENAQSEVVKAMAEIESTRDKIRTAKIRLVAARKMKEAARAAEAVAIAEIEAVTGSINVDKAEAVTISAEEYAVLACSAREAEEEARKRVEYAMARVEEANVSKMNVLKKVDEAAQEIETSKRVLEEAVERVDAANASKIEAEEALRNWRSENGQRRRLSSSVNNTSKFKSKRESTRLMDVNGLHLTYDVVHGSSSSSVPVLKPTMSIGQILSKKLLLAEDSDMNVASERRKMSLGQMLAKNSNSDKTVSKRSEGKENGKRSTTRKRKSFGFAKISVLLNKESKNKKKKKKIALNLR
ncbi:unnamed protein product [Arabidopsis arenosa]|uniref:WEB family protein n=1 Tax=Arabidopsis arenosa TaxID=38785 RepID=A0A8S2A5P0_ARAAE|nr:unnamed protein product [Arabidopsis arenosa]